MKIFFLLLTFSAVFFLGVAVSRAIARRRRRRWLNRMSSQN